MFSAKSIVATLLSAAALVSAAPTPTNGTVATTTYHLTGVTHTVVAGKGGLKFDPDNVVAEIGDVVEWHYLPANHAVAQSSFFDPCKPLEDASGKQVGFFSDFNFATSEGQSDKVFQVVVEDKKPTWFYCPQLKGEHCKNGMVGVINQNFDNQAFSLRAHREAAAKVDEIIIPDYQQGGYVIPNPNPNGGF
ncbi:hypothetical protein MKZ38_005389 [Zalerion maritima]|uniref:Plastocyanin n=1 Tax=Zalerion maritima TaxID=339359 RepID=A0AAD5WP09_9PEZI|nr:hypothetical protein MKZ38_005389 [Zalerion maritima]